MTIKVAIVGAGLMGGWHAHSSKMLKATITAVVDRDLALAQRLADRVGAAVFSDIEAALSQTDIDVVHICTPLASHVSLAKTCLEAGVHVFVEKPIAATFEETKGLYELAAQHDLLLCPVHQFAFQPGIEQLQQRLAHWDEKPSSVFFDFASAGAEGKDPSQLNNILIEILPHPLSILLELWPGEDGSAKLLDLSGWTIDNPKPGELFLYGRHHDVPVSIKISLSARPTHCYMKVYHSKGAVNLNLFHGYAVEETDQVSRLQKILSPFALSFRTLLTAAFNLLRRVLNKEPAYPGLRRLIAKFYDATAGKGAAPISSEDSLSVANACEQVAKQIN